MQRRHVDVNEFSGHSTLYCALCFHGRKKFWTDCSKQKKRIFPIILFISIGIEFLCGI